MLAMRLVSKHRTRSSVTLPVTDTRHAGDGPAFLWSRGFRDRKAQGHHGERVPGHVTPSPRPCLAGERRRSTGHPNPLTGDVPAPSLTAVSLWPPRSARRICTVGERAQGVAPAAASSGLRVGPRARLRDPRLGVWSVPGHRR